MYGFSLVSLYSKTEARIPILWSGFMTPTDILPDFDIVAKIVLCMDSWQEEVKTTPTHTPNHTVDYDEACRYAVQVQALFNNCGKGESEISEREYYGTVSSFWVSLHQLVIKNLLNIASFIGFIGFHNLQTN